MELNNTASCDWSDPPKSSLDYHSSPSNHAHKIGIYGWRKRCLYLFICLLIVMVTINMALTIWIVKVLDFSVDGMGKLRILNGGLRLEGEAEFMRALYTTNIKARKDRPLRIKSGRNLTLNARNQAGDITTRLFLGDEKLEVMASQFKVFNSFGKTLFVASDDRIEVAAETLNVKGAGGAVFQGAIQTPLVMSEYTSDLKIESPTRSLDFQGPEGIVMESRAGDVHATCLMDLKLQSTGGAVRVDSERVYLNKLPEAATSLNANDHANTLQLCACVNGRLFLAPSKGHCMADFNVCK